MNLHYAPSVGLSVDKPPSCAQTAVASFLGHADGADEAAARPDEAAARPEQGQGGDVDTFTFESTGNEAVTFTLAGDGTAGYVGAAARLQLRRGGAVVNEASGPLPLELTETLAGAGEYQVIVLEQQQPEGDGGEGAGEAEGFRGHYLLTVAPEGGADDLLLEPQPDVEPHE